jgi:hypothetical protein
MRVLIIKFNDLWPTPTHCHNNVVLDKPFVPTRGGCNRSQFFSDFPRSLFIQLGRRFIHCTTEFALIGSTEMARIICRRFFRPKFPALAEHAWFGVQPNWWPAWLIFSPAFFVLWAPAGFRFTCYYYRGAYYKAFWADPMNCAVGEPRKSYLGERYFPLIIQNVHRYFMYLAVIFIGILAYDAWKAMWFTENGAKHFGIGVGTIVLTLNAVFLGSYTFGCHSLRHLIGGFLDAKSKVPTCAKAYNCVSCLNKRHMMWAWISLFWVGFTDVYVRLCAMGVWHDFHFTF